MALKNSQYDTIMREYEQKQLHSQDVLNAHYQRVYDCIPEIRDLENAISHLSVQKARNLLEGDETALSSLKEEIIWNLLMNVQTAKIPDILAVRSVTALKKRPSIFYIHSLI